MIVFVFLRTCDNLCINNVHVPTGIVVLYPDSIATLFHIRHQKFI